MTTAAKLEVADIIRGTESQLASRIAPSREQWRVLRAIRQCRTAALGGHVERCSDCDHQRIAYNSCRNRHCPKCQAGARAKWMEARASELLPVPYFHIVFTMPSELAPLALQNRRVMYGLLMRAAGETLKEVAANPCHLGADIGGLAVLHTWGQNLMHHPHVHCVVPAGGLSCERTKWVNCQRSKKSGKLFFLPVRVLSRVFRGKFIAGLKLAFQRGELEFHGRLSHLSDRHQFETRLNMAVRQDWVVYAKRPFGSPEQVLKYLSRYTHRVAIANNRLLSYASGKVTFRWRNYAADGTWRTMILDDVEFVRRFLLHTLPTGFHRIRHFGFLANRHRAERLKQCRHLLSGSTCEAALAKTTHPPAVERESNTRPECVACGSTRIVRIEIMPWRPTPHHRVPRPHFAINRSQIYNDTS